MARMGKSRGAQRVMVGNPEEKTPLGRSSRVWDDNIKINLK